MKTSEYRPSLKSDIDAGFYLLGTLRVFSQQLDAEIEAKTCRDAEGRFASCGLAAGTGNSAEGSARRRKAGKRRRQGPQTGVGAASRKARRKRAGKKNASRRKWLEDLKANKYGIEGKHLYRSQFKERRELADVIKSDRRESRAEERTQRRDLAREIKAERKESRRDQSKERAKLKRDQAKEIDRESRSFDRQESRLDGKYEAARATAKNPASLERQYRERKQELADARAERMQDLSDEHKQARRDLRESHRTDREMQRLDQQQRSDSLKDDWRTAHADEHLSHREQAFDLHTSHRAERAELVQERINELREDRGEKGYKAATGDDVPAAESILGAALEATGHADGWEAGTLTDEQALDVLHQIRMDARAWFRAEAQAVLNDVTGLEAKALFGAAKAKVGAFFDKAKKHVREIIAAGILAVAGPGPVLQQEAVADPYRQQVEIQAECLGEFRKQIVAESKPLDGAFVARAEMYGNAAWSATQEIVRGASQTLLIFDEEMREHIGKDRPCKDCREEVAKRWAPIGTLRSIGDSECKSGCHCVFRFRKDKGQPHSAGRGPLWDAAFGRTG